MNEASLFQLNVMAGSLAAHVAIDRFSEGLERAYLEMAEKMDSGELPQRGGPEMLRTIAKILANHRSK